MGSKTSLVVQDQNWSMLTGFLPVGWQKMAIELNACQRLRGIPSVDVLLRMLLVHVSEGLSLVQTCNIARQAGWASVSDVALLKRLRSAEEWLRWMSHELAGSSHPGRLDFSRPAWLGTKRVRSFDATVITEQGSTGTDWRLHYSLGLFDLRCHEFVLSDPSVGEKVGNFAIGPDDFIVADRAYCNWKSIMYIQKHQGQFLLRYKPKSVPLFTGGLDPEPFDVLASARQVELGQPQGFLPLTPNGDALRMVIHKKSPQAAEEARKAYRKYQKKKQRKVNPQVLELHGYVVLLSNALEDAVTDTDLLNLYRLRWQIELAFKRLKSIMGLGHLPKYDPKSCRSWLYGKLLTALLVENLVEHARLFSPWGYPLDQTGPT